MRSLGNEGPLEAEARADRVRARQSESRVCDDDRRRVPLRGEPTVYPRGVRCRRYEPTSKSTVTRISRQRQLHTAQHCYETVLN